MSICKDCTYRRKTWSEKLTEANYMGCILLALDENQGGIDEYDLLDTIKAEEIGIGWITNNTMAINNMIITKGVTHCKKYQKDYNYNKED